MATDRLKIFNKEIADKLISQGLREDFILSVCFSEGEIYLDYYGCFAHLKAFGWKNTISSLEIFLDNEDGETFILLRPDHIDKILDSLRKHKKDLTIMSDEEIEMISEFKDFCVQNSGFKVAYMFDF